MIFPPRVVLASNAQVLRWQLRWRAGVACALGVVVAGLQQRGWLAGAVPDLALVLAGYLVLVTGAALFSDGRVRSPSGAISLGAYVTVFADVAVLIATTAVISRPGDHDWVLVTGFFIVHLAEYSFGRRASVLALVATLTGYLLLATWRRQAAPVEWAEAIIAAFAFVAVALAFLAQYASRRRRLRRIIALFDRAEEGDVSGEYDVDADRCPDAVTAVGGAYNRVRARFENLVLTDPLTGCLNRRGFEQALDRELARAERAESEVALLAIDIDNFKAVNDTFGHMAGDAALQQLGTLLMATARAGDVVARIGGDEFVVICPDTSLPGAEQLGTRMCELVEARAFDGHGARVRMTISGGIASIDATAADHTASELQLRADRALYDAKRAGRNRVRCWDLTTA